MIQADIGPDQNLKPVVGSLIFRSREIERMEGGSPTKGNNLITMVLVFYFAKKVFGVEGCRDRVINLRDSAFISGGRAVCTGPSSHHQGEIATTKR